MRPENVQSMNSAQNDSQPSILAPSNRHRSKRAWPGRTPRRSASSKRHSRKTLRRREENSGWKRRSSVCPRKSHCSKAQPSGAKASKEARLKSASRIVTPSNIRTLETASMAVLLAGFGGRVDRDDVRRSEEHTSELQSRLHLVCRLLLEKKKDFLDHAASAVPLHRARRRLFAVRRGAVELVGNGQRRGNRKRHGLDARS